MNHTVRIVRVLVSLLGLALIVLGALFWAGRALSRVPLHMLLGALFVVCLWVLAGLAFRARASRGLAFFVLVWSLIVLAFGVAQVRLLPGSRHWVIQSSHLVIGLIAIGLGHALARRIVRRAAAGAQETS